MPEASTELEIRKNDIILIVLIAVLCAALFASSFVFSKKGENVRIYVNGTLFAEKKLAENSVTEVDGLLTVVIENGTVHAENASCPNGDCMKTTARFAGDSIVCLPNRVLIRITGERVTDAVSG